MSATRDKAPQVIPSGDSSPVDLLVIGGGPIGLFATFYAGMRQMRVTVIDSLPHLGGQLATLYPEKHLYDVPGFPRILAKGLAASLVQQAMQADPEVLLNERVLRLCQAQEDPPLWQVVTDKRCHAARSVVICAGVGAMVPKRLPLPEADRFEGMGLEYVASALASYHGKRVLIVGGGDSAVDWANAIAPVAAQLTLVHRRDVFRAHENAIARLRASVADIRPFHELNALHGDSRLEHVTLLDTRTGETHLLRVDQVLVNLGIDSSLGPIKDWGVRLNGNAINVDSAMQTNLPGVFAAGDVCSYPGKLKLIATGFGEAAMAVNQAKKHIDPAANLFPGHSTNVAHQRLPRLRHGS